MKLNFSRGKGEVSSIAKTLGGIYNVQKPRVKKAQHNKIKQRGTGLRGGASRRRGGSYGDKGSAIRGRRIHQKSRGRAQRGRGDIMSGFARMDYGQGDHDEYQDVGKQNNENNFKGFSNDKVKQNEC